MNKMHLGWSDHKTHITHDFLPEPLARTIVPDPCTRRRRPLLEKGIVRIERESRAVVQKKTVREVFHRTPDLVAARMNRIETAKQETKQLFWKAKDKRIVPRVARAGIAGETSRSQRGSFHSFSGTAFRAKNFIACSGFYFYN